MREGKVREAAATCARAGQLVLCLCLLASPSALAQPPELAPLALADQLRLEIAQALEKKDYAAVLAHCETYRKLESEGVAIPNGLFFAEAEAAQGAGDWLRARSALGAYLERADATDPLYPAALKLYPVVETEIARQYEEQERAARAARDAELRAQAERKAAERRRVVEELLNDFVPVPSGKFRMGDLSKHGDEDERPEHTVEVVGFRMGRHEVTFEQYDAFCEATGRQPPDDRGWGRGRRPVINVSWQDANEFIGWLSEQTGQQFRLPTEAEWEYAARAGSATDYWWGDEFSPDFANAAGTGGRDRWTTTAPVGEFPSNAFGLYDMSGNVREWVQDCWIPDYAGRPKTAAARTGGDCTKRVVRGGAWNLGPGWQRSANRDFDDQLYRFVDRGFRLAREP
jgi:formylglycine-generating enzyme required for sulfatase activity